MTKTELAYSIGEFISMEVDDAAKVSYAPETEKTEILFVKMENGKKFSISITEEN